MNLFLKIFLWFLAAITLMVGVVAFLNWSVQTEPVVSRWQNSVRNQMSIFAATAAQIYDREGESGLREFLDRLRTAETVSEVDVVRRSGQPWIADVPDLDGYHDLVENAFIKDAPQIELSSADTALSARSFTLGSGEQFALIVRWERPRAPSFLGDSRARYIRYSGLLITAVLLCYALAMYLTSPIAKLRDAAQTLGRGRPENARGRQDRATT